MYVGKRVKFDNGSSKNSQYIIQPYQKDDGVTVIDGYERGIDLGRGQSNGVKIGWIMQDKTKVLRDANS